VRPHKPQSFGDVPAHRARLSIGVDRRGAGPEQCEHDDRDPVARRIDEERRPDAELMHDETSDRRADEGEGELPDELRQRVRLDEQVPRYKVGNDCTCGRALERLPGAVESGDREQVPQLDPAADCQDAEHRDAGSAQRARGDENPAPLEPVAEHAADEDEGDQRDRLGDAHEGKCRRRVPQVERLPGDGDEEEAVADQGNRPSGPEEREVALSERTEDRDPIHAGIFASSSSGSRPPRPRARA
jgi:hypothetical protein